MNPKLKIGIYGGSFDPVHLGHLLVAQAAIEELALDKLFFVPAAQSPFKPDQKPAPDAIRLQLLNLALAGKINCAVDDQEIRRAGISYTIETVRDYARRFPTAELFYLIGADHAGKLNEWREAAELAQLAEFIAVPRPARSGSANSSGGGNLVFPRLFRGRILRGFPFGVSASEIRARVKAGRPVDTLVPAAVAEAIHNAKLYT
ncbi:MAG TPA: nicotinate-nucleotide adenylyltransferase [Verrucomicrobiae bacterium]